MKTRILTAVIALAFSGIASAQCTVTTGCGQTGTYDVENVSTRYEQSTQQVIVSSNGQELERFSCDRAGGISIQCGDNNTGGGDTTDICDALVNAPQFVKDIYGCN